MARLADLSDAARHDLESMMELHFNALTQRLALLEGEPSYAEANASLRAFGEHLQGLFHQKPARVRHVRRRHDGEEGSQDEGRKGGEDAKGDARIQAGDADERQQERPKSDQPQTGHRHRS